MQPNSRKNFVNTRVKQDYKIINLITQYHNTAYLELIMGPMFSGKSTFVVNKHEECKANHITSVIIDHIYNIRNTPNRLKTHTGRDTSCIHTENIIDVFNNPLYASQLENAKVILINEAQFFSNLVTDVQYVLSLNKIIFVSGLDGDFNGQKFGQIADLIPISDEITKLASTCAICKIMPGIFTHRTVVECEQIVIGDEDKYIPLCRKCYTYIH